jgi:hypothetical protein
VAGIMIGVSFLIDDRLGTTEGSTTAVTKRRRRRAHAWAVVAGVLLAVLVGFLYTAFLDGGLSWPDALSSLQLVVASGFCATFGWAAWFWADAIGDDEPLKVLGHDVKRWTLVLFVLAILSALLTAVLFTSMFARYVYGKIPAQYGGNKPTQALILFTEPGALEASQLGISLQPNSTELSRPVSVLLDGDTYYAVRTEDGRVVQVSKSDVDGLQEDSRAPYAVDVQTRNRGLHADQVEAGDQLVLTYSEPMDPGSLIPGWTGEKPTQVHLVVSRDGDGTAMMRFLIPDKRRKPALGEVQMDTPVYARVFDHRPWRATVGKGVGGRIVMTVEASHSLPHRTVNASDTMQWTPSTRATDLAGNHVSDHQITELKHAHAGAISAPDDSEF